VFGFLILSFDPFQVALSRLLHLDGLVSALMLLLLAFASYVTMDTGHRSVLSVRGSRSGMADQSPAFFLIPFLGLWVGWNDGLGRRKKSGGHVVRPARERRLTTRLQTYPYGDVGEIHWREFLTPVGMAAVVAAVFVLFGRRCGWTRSAAIPRLLPGST